MNKRQLLADYINGMSDESLKEAQHLIELLFDLIIDSNNSTRTVLINENKYDVHVDLVETAE